MAEVLTLNKLTPASTIDVYDGGRPAHSDAPAYNFFQDESFEAGSDFRLGFVTQMQRTGGTGHREAMLVSMLSSGAKVGEMLVGVHQMCHVKSGSGAAFGSNPYVWIESTVDTTASAVGEEINTDVRNTYVTQKIGLQIVDVNTSTGGGSVTDAAIVIGKQNGARGFSNGIQFGVPSGGAMQATGNLIAAPYAFTTTNGIDFSAVNFTGSVMKSVGFNLSPVGDVSARTLTVAGVATPTLPNRLSIGAGTSATVGLAGTSAPLPAAPAGYLIAFIGGTGVKIPYYNG